MVVLIRGIFNIIIPACLFALLLLAILAWSPVYFDESAIINNAGLQRTRVEVIANDVQRLETLPDQDITSIASLQAALPMWEKEQSILASYPDTQIQTYIQEANSPYRLIDQAAHTILSEYNANKHVDMIQINIVQQYEHQYVVTMNDLVYYIQMQSEMVNQWIAIVQEVILALVAVAMAAKYFLLRRYVYPHLIEMEQVAQEKRDRPDS